MSAATHLEEMMSEYKSLRIKEEEAKAAYLAMKPGTRGRPGRYNIWQRYSYMVSAKAREIVNHQTIWPES